MNENTAMFLLTTFGAMLGEIYGIWILRQSSRFTNPSLAITLGKIACLLGVIGFVLAFIAWRLEMWA
jgi:hypothetical protein